MAKDKVLIVEDEDNIRSIVARGLRNHGYDALEARDGPAALALLEEHTVTVIILDILLPGDSGDKVLSAIRALNERVRVVMLSALDDEEIIVATLGVGADDYVTKPFKMNELIARVSKEVRRFRETPTQPYRCGELEVDFAARTSAVRGTELELTRRQFDVLVCLASNAGSVLSHEMIFAKVWGSEYERNEAELVRRHISNIRAAITPHLSAGQKADDYIETLGGGYRIRRCSQRVS